MPVYLYGNANGTYQPPNIDVFALAKAQNNKPVMFKDTEAGKNMPAVKVNISAEGLRALHGTKLPGSMDVNAMNEQRKYESEHIPIESFYSRLSREYSNGVESVRAVETDHKVTWADKENALLNGFRTIADEIAAGYADGTRIRYALDNDSEDGYRKLSKDEELDILQQEFEEFTESRFGKKQQEAVEMVNKQTEELQKVLEKSGKSSIRQRAYQTEKIPDDFLEKILERARMHIAGLK